MMLNAACHRRSRSVFPPYSVLRLGNAIVLAGAALLSGCSTTTEAMRRVDINFDYVAAEAAAAASQRYAEPEPLAPVLANLSYSQYQQIGFKHDDELWKQEGLPFTVAFFHLGYLFKHPVALHEFTATHEQHIRYLSGFFDFGANTFADQLPASLDYAGFRVAALGEEGEIYREAASFLGASYFRAVGVNHRYGSSARGIAINAGMAEPEEFPRFKRFWLGKPQPDSRELVIFAQLDGPSVTGAYRFVIRPGVETVVDVKARIFLRENVRSFGIAPITSMFWRGENRTSKRPDYRPEVHDADGLVVLDSDEAPIFRPLDLGDRTRLSYFSLGSVRGFGLLQRDRDFDHYQDLEAEYHHRPTVWIETKSDWGAGFVKLVELPTVSEFDDNIVAFWEPAVLPEKGDVVNYEYSIRWTSNPAPSGFDAEMALATRIGEDLSYPGTHVFVVDFGPSAEPEPGAEPPKAVAEVGKPSSLENANVVWNPYSKTWRATLRVTTVDPGSPAVELRCRLQFPDGRLSEQWSYQWTPSAL